MANVNFVKVVDSLPGVLEFDTLYFVKNGSTVSAFISNKDGTPTAYPIQYDYPDATGSSSGLLSPSLFTKLSDLPTSASLTSTLDGKQKTIIQSSTPPPSPSVGDLWIEI